MRNVNEIILHCSATMKGKDYSVKDIDRWHRDRGYKGVGYHFVIRLDGTIELGRSVEEIGAHTLEHNLNSVGVCYIGGLDLMGRPCDTRTEAQNQSLKILLSFLHRLYPQATLHGHNEFAAKACPCFDVKDYEYIFK